MKQKDIVAGQSYLYTHDGNVEHRKFMNNTVVTVVRRVHGKRMRFDPIQNGRPKKPMKFLLTNGQYANAANLSEIKTTTLITL